MCITIFTSKNNSVRELHKISSIKAIWSIGQKIIYKKVTFSLIFQKNQILWKITLIWAGNTQRHQQNAFLYLSRGWCFDSNKLHNFLFLVINLIYFNSLIFSSILSFLSNLIKYIIISPPHFVLILAQYSLL